MTPSKLVAIVVIVVAAAGAALWLLRGDDAVGPAATPHAGRAPATVGDPGTADPLAGRPGTAATPPSPVAVRPFSGDDEARRVELTCVTEGGLAVAGVLVARVDAGAAAAMPAMLATSSAAGIASFAAGPSAVTCCHPDFLPAVVTLPASPAMLLRRQTVVMRAGTVINGTVVDQDGAALAGVTVHVEVGAPMALPAVATAGAEIAGVDVRNCDAAFRTLRRKAVTGADGSFVMHGVPAGNHLLSPEKPGYVPAGTRDASPIKTDAEPARLRMARVYAMGTRVTGADDVGAAAARSLITVVPRAPASLTRIEASDTAARGLLLADLETRLGPGVVFQLWVAQERSQLGGGAIVVKATARAEGGETGEVDVRLVPADTFAITDCFTVDLVRVVPTLATVRVTAPLPMQLLRAPPTDRPGAIQPVVDVDGVQVFHVEAGSYIASAKTVGFGSDATDWDKQWDTAVEAKAATVTNVTVAGHRMPARVRVTVTDGAGHPTDQYTVVAGPATGPGTPTFLGAGGGGETLFWARPGPLLIRVFDPAFRVLHRAEITVRDNDTEIPVVATYGPK